MARILGPVLSLGLAAQAAAQDSCTHAPLIAQMANTVLTERLQLPRLSQARFGDIAAFFAIEYGGFDEATVLRALAEGDGRPPRFLDDLQLAYRFAQPGGVASWAMFPDAAGAVAGLQPSALRALIIADGGDTFLRLWSMGRADPQLADRFNMADFQGVYVASVVSDQPDALRADFAAKAEAAGELMMAAALYGDLSDRPQFDAFMERHRDNADFIALRPVSMIASSSIGALYGTMPLRDPTAPGWSDQTLQVFSVFRGALAGQPADFMLVTLNQTGQTDVVTQAAMAYLDQLDTGAIDPVADPEAAWLFQYKQLVAGADRDQIINALGAFDWPSPSVRSYAGLAIDSLDVMIAKDAFGPFMRGETASVPAAPADFAGTLDWTTWQETARAVRENRVTDIAPDRVWIAVELLWETADYDQAAAIATARMDVPEKLRVLRDAMMRLDAICGPKIGLPGGAVRHGGRPVFKVD